MSLCVIPTNCFISTIVIQSCDKRHVKFRTPASVRGGALTTNSHFGHVIGLRQTTYDDVKVGGLVDLFLIKYLPPSTSGMRCTMGGQSDFWVHRPPLPPSGSNPIYMYIYIQSFCKLFFQSNSQVNMRTPWYNVLPKEPVNLLVLDNLLYFLESLIILYINHRWWKVLKSYRLLK